MMKKEWPKDFPENCPPVSAVHTTDNFYRLVDNVPPTKMDFLRSRDEPKNIGKDYGGKHFINSYGLSIFKEEKDAIDKQLLFSNATKNKKITHGNLNDDLGQIARTYRPSHHTLWLYQDAEPEKYLNLELKEKP